MTKVAVFIAKSKQVYEIICLNERFSQDKTKNLLFFYYLCLANILHNLYITYHNIMDTQDKLISFQNFLIVATSDGALAEDEKGILINIGIDMGLTPEDLKPIISAETLPFRLHKNAEDNIADLGDMLTIAASDGTIYQTEQLACKEFAKMANISDEMYEEMLQVALNDAGEEVIVEEMD